MQTPFTQSQDALPCQVTIVANASCWWTDGDTRERATDNENASTLRRAGEQYYETYYLLLIFFLDLDFKLSCSPTNDGHSTVDCDERNNVENDEQQQALGCQPTRKTEKLIKKKN